MPRTIAGITRAGNPSLAAPKGGKEQDSRGELSRGNWLDGKRRCTHPGRAECAIHQHQNDLGGNEVSRKFITPWRSHKRRHPIFLPQLSRLSTYSRFRTTKI